MSRIAHPFSTQPRQLAGPSRFIPVLVSIVLITIASSMMAPAQADAQNNRFRNSIEDQEQFEKFAGTVGNDKFLKFAIDVENDRIFFFNAKFYKMHIDFFYKGLEKRKPTPEEREAFLMHYGPIKNKYILGYITHHTEFDKWTYAFWAGDKISLPNIAMVYTELSRSFFAPLNFRADSTDQETMAQTLAGHGYPTLGNTEIYKMSEYQSFNNGFTVGKLMVVPPNEDLSKLNIGRGTVVILQTAYPDLPTVAGIMTSVPSTPLSHIHLRARAWRIPSTSYANALKDYEKFNGQIVYYEASDSKHLIRPARPDEIKRYEERLEERRRARIPTADVATKTIAPLEKLKLADAQIYGAKAANLGVMAGSKIEGVNVPKGFAIPFWFYVRHARKWGVENRLYEIIKERKFRNDPAWRKTELAGLRKTIMEKPMDKALLDALYKKVTKDLGGKGVFVRSSTNAEDLENFSGAGLYDTVANVKSKAELEKAVKTVWASLWNERAVIERFAFGIDHRAVFAGVIIQVGVNADAAGVLVSTNIYDGREDETYTINAKHGLGIRVVEGTTIPEEVLYDTKKDVAQIITRSDDAKMLIFDKSGGLREVEVKSNAPILTKERAKALCDAVTKVKPLFKSWGTALDIEWVLEGEKFWLVQSRPFVE